VLYPRAESKLYLAADACRERTRDAEEQDTDRRRNAMSTQTQTLRASDLDRQQVVDRLRTAVEGGRLTLGEYLDRMGHAYEAVTLGELVPLCADLPAAEPEGAAPAVPSPAPRPVRRAGPAGLPGWLRVQWGIWLTAVSVNVMVWLLITVTSGHLPYPWPLWVAGPYGAALLGISAGVTRLRRP
jgi:hypothetical protein